MPSYGYYRVHPSHISFLPSHRYLLALYLALYNSPIRHRVIRLASQARRFGPPYARVAFYFFLHYGYRLRILAG